MDICGLETMQWRASGWGRGSIMPIISEVSSDVTWWAHCDQAVWLPGKWWSFESPRIIPDIVLIHWSHSPHSILASHWSGSRMVRLSLVNGHCSGHYDLFMAIKQEDWTFFLRNEDFTRNKVHVWDEWLTWDEARQAWVKSINKILLDGVRKPGQPKNVQILNIMRLGLSLWWFGACAAFVMMGTDASNVNILICWYQRILITIKHWFKLEYISIGHPYMIHHHTVPDLSILSLVLRRTNDFHFK